MPSVITTIDSFIGAAGRRANELSLLFSSYRLAEREQQRKHLVYARGLWAESLPTKQTMVMAEGYCIMADPSQPKRGLRRQQQQCIHGEGGGLPCKATPGGKACG
jgi:hypothetical protein